MNNDDETISGIVRKQRLRPSVERRPIVMKPRILVVEDDARTAASVALYLRHGGYDVVTAATGSEALDEIGRALPDLIVLDLMLPGRERPRGVPRACASGARCRSSC